MESLAVTAGALGVASFTNLVVRTVGEIHAFYSSIKDAPLVVTTILADLDLLITIIQDSAYNDAAIATCDTHTCDKARTRPSNANGQENTRSSTPSIVLSRRIGDAPDFIDDPIVDTASHKDVIEPINSEPQPKIGGHSRQKNEALDDTLDQDATANDSTGIESRLASSETSTHSNHALSETSLALEVTDNRASGYAKQINSEVVLCAQSTLRKSERFAGQQALAMQRKLPTESRSRSKRSTQTRNYFSRPLFQSDILGILYRCTKWTKTTVSIANDVSEKPEVTTSFVYHPGSWQIICGFTTVLSFSLHDPYPLLTPKRAVPDGALIFDLCLYGNVDAVRLLFERGEASVLDVNPKGLTPLHVAGAQYEMAKYLLLHGADPEAHAYKNPQR
ncbi:MAG: hypothetical protein Q9157_000320 [Trypethelium eluteriae]